ncbi:uncharacterized protein LOC113382768 [Ctenocephalides felis]|uniref:uncharacterized protein LOC113382768 n=1 Tax=Ctenocephalides felis TaxID=7515 RepID=UPI000E6E3AC5|nr:uncharacterized protein LOC113382768 [Ctenocephalides felis]
MTSGLKMNLSSITKNLTDLKSNLTTNISNLTNSIESTTSNANANKTSSEPEIGFTLDLNQRDQEVAVTVTRAKNLPTKFGLKQVKGYFLKVKLYPGQKKYESNTVPVTNSSDTIFNEVFRFSVSRDPNKDIDKNNSSKFEKFSQKFIQKFGQKNKSDDAGKEENINKNFNANDAIDLNGFFVTITLCASMSDLMINENTYKWSKQVNNSNVQITQINAL